MVCMTMLIARARQGTGGEWLYFLIPDPYSKNFCISNNFITLVSDIHPYPNSTLAKIQNKQAVVKGSPTDLHFGKLIHPSPVT